MTIAGKCTNLFLKQAQGGEVNVTTYAGGTANLKIALFPLILYTRRT